MRLTELKIVAQRLFQFLIITIIQIIESTYTHVGFNFIDMIFLLDDFDLFLV